MASYHKGKEIGILLEWDDPVGNGEILRHQDFRDAAAVQFPMLEGEPTYAMGAHTGPVNIWHWKADWEADLTHYRDVQDRYPNMDLGSLPILAGRSSVRAKPGTCCRCLSSPYLSDRMGS